ncbi:5'-deoxynucleotidase HDDC2 isoform X2 [Parasteatoda tepidariorum]|uniref:5'-deoxynucleotidase HDDC2 isoform X2 n=1 Tax=Parasteatoda tepidariorum TaxID=114398 RepID=UPI0039BD0322
MTMAESSLSCNRSVLDFLMLVGKLKHIKRTGWVRSNVPDCETIAGHMYRMSVMAFLLGDQISSNLDRNKCIKMCLVHDMAECIVGDITPFCGVSAEEKHSREVAAMKRLSSLVGKEVGAEFLSLFMEYEEKETAESKFVHDLDKFDMILQAYEYEKESNNSLDLQQFFNSTEGIFQNPMVLEWVSDLKKQRGKPSSEDSL